MIDKIKMKVAHEVGTSNTPATIDHDAAMIEELRADPTYAEIYLQTALEDIYEPGGIGAFLIALRQIIEARGGVGEIAQKSGLARQHIYRALSANGNPTLTTITEITRAAGVRLAPVHMNKRMPNHIGHYISEEMAHLNMSLRELAQALDVSPSTIGRIVKGRTAVTPAIAERLASVLGSTPEMWLRLQEAHSLALNK